VTGDGEAARRAAEDALRAAADIREDEDRDHLLADLATIPGIEFTPASPPAR
jgi:hypothetical protein